MQVEERKTRPQIYAISASPPSKASNSNMDGIGNERAEPSERCGTMQHYRKVQAPSPLATHSKAQWAPNETMENRSAK
jgi:hypothetical protein